MRDVTVRIGSSGRLVIPAHLRKALGVKQGDELLVRVVDGELRLTTPALAIKRAQEMVRRYVPPDRSLADELLRERRQASAEE